MEELIQVDSCELEVERPASKGGVDFSSENYKIEISNIPKIGKFYIAKQLIEHYYKLCPHKIKLSNHQDKIYVAFKSEDERSEAINRINAQPWKGRQLVAKPAKARDPLNRFNKNDREASVPGAEIKFDPTPEEINSKVAPLWDKPYSEQLDMKEKLMLRVLDMRKGLKATSNNLKTDAPNLFEWLNKNSPTCCPFDGVVPSPRLVGYRNKCEFNISGEGIIGFKMGRFRDGSEQVASPPRNNPLPNEIMFKIITTFQEFIVSNDENKTKLCGYCRSTHSGNLRQLTIRTNELGESLVIIDMNPSNLSKVELDEEIDKVCNLLKGINGVISIYFNLTDKENFTCSEQTLKLVYGESHIYECLSIRDDSPPLKFRIGPNSFFQVNTKAAELLYRSIIDLAQLTSDSLVLDMGCGTGTISLSLAKEVSYVIGVELVKSAIEDAKINAETNGIKNVVFFCGRAEELINETISILRGKQLEQNGKGEIVAIVDPPRTGFNNSFIKSLRKSNIKKIIYVACDPVANSNLISLCRPTSKAYQGDPFVPTRAKAFDLFPHTNFSELVLVYERLAPASASTGDAAAAAAAAVTTATPEK